MLENWFHMRIVGSNRRRRRGAIGRGSSGAGVIGDWTVAPDPLEEAQEGSGESTNVHRYVGTIDALARFLIL